MGEKFLVLKEAFKKVSLRASVGPVGVLGGSVGVWWAGVTEV